MAKPREIRITFKEKEADLRLYTREKVVQVLFKKI